MSQNTNETLLNMHATQSGITKALDAKNNGFALQAKYILVGKGHQNIEQSLNDAGLATIDTLADQVGNPIDILSDERIKANQWQMTVDIAGLANSNYLLSEIALADEDGDILAIYGHPTQALFEVGSVLSHVFISNNLILGAYPEGSVEIVSANQPFNLTFIKELAVIHNAIGALNLQGLQNTKDKIEIKKQLNNLAGA